MPVNLRLRWYRAVTTIASSIGNAVAAGLSAAVGSGAGSAPTITSPSFLVAGTVNTLYPTTYFTASGSTPITWSITAGTLPAGMTFTTVNNQGVLAGTPTATSSGSITFTATNALGSDGRALTLTVNATGAGPVLVSAPTIVVWRAA